MQNYAFVQYEKLEDAEYALKKTNNTKFEGRTITVEVCCCLLDNGHFLLVPERSCSIGYLWLYGMIGCPLLQPRPAGLGR